VLLGVLRVLVFKSGVQLPRGLLLAVSIMIAAIAQTQTLKPTHLRCEYLENPIGIGETSPRLSWWCDSKVRGDKQTAYQILVASSLANLKANKGDLWNSGKVSSDESTQIEYAGKPLGSRARAWWKVRVWDKDRNASPYSKPAAWEIGLLKKSDWQAAWIGVRPPSRIDANIDSAKWIWYPEGNPALDAPLAPRYFRTKIHLDTPEGIDSIDLWAVVDDEATVYLNGQKIGDIHGFKTITVISFPKKLLKAGDNVVAIKAWNTGGPAGFRGTLNFVYETPKGTAVEQLGETDDKWLSSQTASAGWRNTGFDDSSWKSAIVLPPTGWPEPHPDAPLEKALYLRTDFVVRGRPSAARIYATARGAYEIYLDGKRVSDDVLNPGFTDYRKRIQYQTFDVTNILRPGKHTIGIVLGDGWYVGSVGWGGRGQYGSHPMALAQLEIDHAREREVIATDESWKVTTGPILTSDIMLGETYDARKELAQWSEPGGDAKTKWQHADMVWPDNTPLVAEPDRPVRKWHELTPKKITQPKRGTYVFDLGQNMVGWARLRVKGSRGKKIQLRFAEVLNPDGTIYTTNLRGAKATDTYICKGAGQEVYEPSFTFHGFRYVEVTGYPGKPTKSAITGIVIGSDIATTGTFECSNKMVNQLQHNIYWGMRGNYLSIPTDCPQRDERLGWMGDAQIFAPTATFNCDVAAFMTKWLQDVRDGQNAGYFADVSPRVLVGDAAPAWGDAGVIVPWTMYEAYNDKRLLARSYPSMKAWVDAIYAKNPNYLWLNGRNNDYGDWLSIKPDTPKEVLATAFFARSTDLVARAAEVLGKKSDSNKYRSLFENIKAAFNSAYIAQDGRIKGDTQACYALALAFNLLPDQLRANAAQYLADDIDKKHDGHLSTGFVGVKYLAPALAESGRLDLAYKLLLNDTFPSWMYSIKQGATTIWERWDGYTKEKGFQDPGMNSFNHYSFGSIGEWMYATIGGLQMTSPGWKTFLVHPQPGGGITWAKTGFDSPHGHIQCNWSFTEDAITIDLTVPSNTTAEVWLVKSNKITLDGKNILKSNAARFKRYERGFDIYQVGGGSYRFQSLLFATPN